MSDSNLDEQATQHHPELDLPLASLPGSHPCNECGQCCSYLAIEIDKPTAFQDYDHIHWYLVHRNVSVYIDWEGDWYVEFRTVCEHLTPAKTCGIYHERPKICSSFSWDECEVTTGGSAWKYRFETYPEFLEWMKSKRPMQYDRYAKRRRKLVAERKDGAPRKKKAEKASPRGKSGKGAR